VSRETKAAVALLFTMCVWGLAPVFVRILSVELKPANALVIRYPIVALIFAGLLAFGGGRRIARRDWPRIILASLIGILGYNIGSVYGFELAPASIGGLIIGTQPLLIVLLAALIGREPLSPGAILGMIVAFSGTVVLFWNELSFSSDNFDIVWGGLLIFLSGGAWAVYVVTAKPLIVKYGPVAVSGLSIVIATIPMLLLASPETFATIGRMTAAQWAAMIFLIVVSTFIASITWNYGAGRLSAAATGAFLYLVPVLAVFAGVAFLDETISPSILSGGILILAGVALTQFGERWRITHLSRHK